MVWCLPCWLNWFNKKSWGRNGVCVGRRVFKEEDGKDRNTTRPTNDTGVGDHFSLCSSTPHVDHGGLSLVRNHSVPRWKGITTPPPGLVDIYSTLFHILRHPGYIMVSILVGSQPDRTPFVSPRTLLPSHPELVYLSTQKERREPTTYWTCSLESPTLGMASNRTDTAFIRSVKCRLSAGIDLISWHTDYRYLYFQHTILSDSCPVLQVQKYPVLQVQK